MTIGAVAPHVSSHSNVEHDPRFKKTQPEQNAEPNFHQSQRFSSQINFQSKKNFSSQMTYQFPEKISEHAFSAVWASVQTKVCVLSQQVQEILPRLSGKSWIHCKSNFLNWFVLYSDFLLPWYLCCMMLCDAEKVKSIILQIEGPAVPGYDRCVTPNLVWP